MKDTCVESSSLKRFISVGELATRSGVAISAIHFYESKGLIMSFRNSGNQRRYPRGVLRLVSIIKVAQRLGFSLEQIKENFSSFPTDHPPTSTDWSKLAKNWEKHLNDQIQLLMSLKSQLNSCIGCGCLSLKDCPLRNPKDKLAKKGPGAHFL